MQPNQKELKESKDIAEQALLVSAGISLFLCVLKLVGFWFTGSMLLLSAFFDSLVDTGVSIINSRVQKASKEAPDREHPFGHGGFQVISSLLQGVVIVFLGIILMNESIRRITGHEVMFELDRKHLLSGVALLWLSALGGYAINLYLSRINRLVEKSRQRSLSLLADRMHYAGDAWTNGLSGLGLFMVWWFEKGILDAYFGIAGALFLFASAAPILRQSMKDILHNEADPAKKDEIVAVVKAVDSSISSVHRLRTRELGPSLFIDFHMTLPAEMSLESAHLIGERVARALRARFPRSDVMIHLDPDSEPEDDFW